MEYRRLLQNGWLPTWTGVDDSQSGSKRLLVRLGRSRERMWVSMSVPSVNTLMMRDLIKHTAARPGSKVSIYPSSSDLGFTRLASVQGYGPYVIPHGINKQDSKIDLPIPSVVGMDIEQSTYYRGGNFPLPHDPLISVAFHTSESISYVGYCIGSHDPNYKFKDMDIRATRLANSTELVRWAIDWLIAHCPDFVIVHNGYAYDIPTMCSHSPSSHDKFFRIVNLGLKAKGMDLSVPGVTMVDTYRYLDKLHRGSYPSLALDSLASTLLGVPKSKQPSLCIPDHVDHNMSDVIYYNAHDAMLHLKVAMSCNCIGEIISLCRVFYCPVSDVTRFLSGVMVSTLLASYALQSGCVIDWSEENWPTTRYRGALVLRPRKGCHTRVAVLDVGSMYPTVMIDLNVSMETVTTMPESSVIHPLSPSLDGASWNFFRDRTVMVQDGVAVCTPRPISGPESRGITCGVLRQLIEDRKRVGKNTPEGWARKIATNSMYGALGASTSGLQSYYGASMVTAGGRFIIRRAVVIADQLGYDVVYGDTDSVFLTARSEHMLDVPKFLGLLYSDLAGTPFTSIRFELEKEYSRLILVKPKMYYGLVPNACTREGSRKDIKGLAPVRKDRPQIVQLVTDQICTMICAKGVQLALPGISKLVLGAHVMISRGAATLQHMSIQQRKGGTSYYVFTDVTGNRVWLDVDNGHHAMARPSVDWVLKSLASALTPILDACGLPDITNLMEMAPKYL